MGHSFNYVNVMLMRDIKPDLYTVTVIMNDGDDDDDDVEEL